MCGIFGQWNLNQRPLGKAGFQQQLDTLTHRGPDAAGTWFNSGNIVGLGQRRLAIVDLDARANQPLHNETNKVHVVVNGEIYNYPQLRKILEEKGHHFSTNTDSEAIVHGWEEWGTELPVKLKGMFSLVVFDEEKQCLFAARDPFGIKPFYYSATSVSFVFSSELKAIATAQDFKKELDHTSVCDFFVYRYIPSPKTIWKNVSKLPPAHSLLLNKDGEIRIACYWQPVFGSKKQAISDTVDDVRELLTTSVKQHLLSDVPVGTFLSGGFDSTTLAMLQKEIGEEVRSFSIGFENWPRSEHLYAEIVSDILETRHKYRVLEGNSLELAEELPWYYDEPNGDISTIPTYLVSQLAAEDVKVVFSGEGADEIFAGYGWHQRLMSRFQISQSNIYERMLGNSMIGVNGYAHAMAMGLYDRKELQQMLSASLQPYIPEDPFWFYRQHYKNELHPLKAFQYLDIKTFMAELVLQKVDRATMAHSLEARVPFLDTDLVQYMMGLDPSSYFEKGNQKPVLKEILTPIFPDIILERKKQGFTGPDRYYQDISWYEKELKDSILVSANIIQKPYLDRAIQNRDYWRLWKITVFDKWYRKWMLMSD
ncbi:MAG: asparagine synthase (glutamine-hydrolyzing) [Bacteroidetes bacterium HGW-Bacteroidetes-21]|jgi:asparagine synthase (glutamine-hydrolysing)|nr:MAG: asparagine synthase (glutamine-hydrolyzing) [Bacteroidetes bacterium HGW-Bacteroidetes-21]